jgi:D-3-phosphoglycerate dehydrogenase
MPAAVSRASRPGATKSKEKRAQAKAGPEGGGRLDAGRARRHDGRTLTIPPGLGKLPVPGEHPGREDPAMPRIVLGRALHPEGQALLEARSDLDLVVMHDPPVAAWHEALAEADGAVLWLERIDAAALAVAPRLRAVSRIGVGFDTVDVPACSARGIPVMVVNGTNDLSVAEHAMMLLLAVARRAVEIDRGIKAGGWWPEGGPRSVDLAGRRALVVGYGRIGTRVAAYLRAFRMEVSVFDPLYHPARIAADGYVVARDLHAALAEADVVSLHCPLTPATRHLMDARAFAALKPGAILVNTARGPIVEEAALADALVSGRLMGAGLDVMESEPPRPGNPLLSLPNVILSPHSAAGTEEGMTRMAVQAARNVLDALDGRPDPAMMVNPEILAR